MVGTCLGFTHALQVTFRLPLRLHQDGGLVLLNLHYGLHEVTLSLFQRLCVCVCVCVCVRARARMSE